MTQLFSNNASSTLLSPIGSSDTQITLQAGDGENYPAIGSSGDFFVGTLEDTSGNVEIVTCTARTGDTVTVVRAAEGTSAQAFVAGSRFEIRVTKETLENFAQKAAGIFTAIVTLPGTDLVTTDATAHAPFRTRYNEVDGLPTRTVDGPVSEAAALYWSVFKAANETWTMGMAADGTFVNSGRIQHDWYGRESGDAAWNIIQETKRPAPEEMVMMFTPEASALSVSYVFEVVDELGVRRQITLGKDGSLSAGGNFELSNVSLKLTEDPEKETINFDFHVRDLLGLGDQRWVSFQEQNFGNDAGDPNTAIGYYFQMRKENGYQASVHFAPDGGIHSSGGNTFLDKVFVADQILEDLAGTELITKTTAEVLLGTNTAISNYYSILLYQNAVASYVTEGLDELLISTGPTVVRYQQIQIEAIFPNAQGGTTNVTMVIDVGTLRLNVDYELASSGNGDQTGTLRVNFSDYETFIVTAYGDAPKGFVRRILGISYAGLPAPAP